MQIRHISHNTRRPLWTLRPLRSALPSSTRSSLSAVAKPELPLTACSFCTQSAQRIHNVLLAQGKEKPSKRLLKLLNGWRRGGLTLSRTEELLIACQAIAPLDAEAFHTALAILSAYEEDASDYRPRMPLYQEALYVAKVAKRAQGALDLVDRFIQRGGWPTTQLLNSAIAACYEAGAPLYALRLIGSFEVFHVEPDDFTLVQTKRALSALEDPSLSSNLNTTFLFQTLSSTLSSTKATNEPSLEVWRQLVWLLCWTSYPGCLASLREIMGATMRRKAADAAHFTQWLQLVAQRTAEDLHSLGKRRSSGDAAAVEQEIRVTMQRRFHQASILLRYAKFNGIVARDALSLEGCMAYIETCVRTNRPHAVRHVVPLLSPHSREGAADTIKKCLAPLFHSSTIAALLPALNVLPIKALVLSKEHWLFDLVAIALQRWSATRSSQCPHCFPHASAVFADAAVNVAQTTGQQKAMLWEYGITSSNDSEAKVWIPPTPNTCPLDYVFRGSPADGAIDGHDDPARLEKEWMLQLSPSQLYEWVRQSGQVPVDVENIIIATAARLPCGNESWKLWRQLREQGKINVKKAKVPMKLEQGPEHKVSVRDLPQHWALSSLGNQAPASSAPQTIPKYLDVYRTALLFRAFVQGGFMGRAWELFLILFPTYRGPLPSQAQAADVAESLVEQLDDMFGRSTLSGFDTVYSSTSAAGAAPDSPTRPSIMAHERVLANE